MADDQGDPRDRAPLEGEVTQGGADRQRQDVAAIDTSVLGGLTRAEIDVQISTAHKFPRVITLVMRQIETFATLDVETATSCFFRKPQREKKKNPATGRDEWVDGYIEGPSIRFAETVMQAWGNGRVASRVTDMTDTEIEATGVFHDLESNVAWAKSVRVPIVGANGNKFPGHLITTLGNAAASKAIRNAIMAGVPRGIWNRGYQAALRAAKGDLSTLGDRRKNLFAKAAEENITQPEIFAMLGVKGEADIDIDKLFDAAALLTAVRDGEATVADLIKLRQAPVDERGLSEAFGKQQTTPKPSATKAAGGATKEAKPATGEQKPAASAPAAEEGKNSKVSVTVASTGSPVATSGPAPREQRSGDGVTIEVQIADDPASRQQAQLELSNRGAQRSGGDAEPDIDRAFIDPETGVVYPTMQARLEAEEAKKAAAAEAARAPSRDARPEPEEQTQESDVATEEFNAFAEAVQATSGWPDLKGVVRDFRRTPAFSTAPQDLQYQALLLALNHANEKGIMGQEGDVQWYRLWLVGRPAPDIVRPAFRKVMRGAEYQGLDGPEKDAIVDETNAATGD